MASAAQALLSEWIKRQAEPAAADWFAAQAAALSAGGGRKTLYVTFGLAPRRLGKADLLLTERDFAAAEAARPGWNPRGWTLDGAARALALLLAAEERFADQFKDLRRTADVGELVALYRGLPLYPAPETLAAEAAEGVRSNIRAAFEAVAHRNPFPAEQFDDARFGQMVLKALFIGAPLAPIVGLDRRVTAALARTLRDFAHERWAASRPVPAELWRCLAPFAAEIGAEAEVMRALSEPSSRAEAAAAIRASGAAGAVALLPEDLREEIRA